MQSINTIFGPIEVFALCQAHAQLESDFNVGGWIRERPSNLRRMASTGVQLSRMQFSNVYGWVDILATPEDGDDSMDEEVRIIYAANAVQYGLPLDEPLKALATRLICADWLHAVRPTEFPAEEPVGATV